MIDMNIFQAVNRYVPVTCEPVSLNSYMMPLKPRILDPLESELTCHNIVFSFNAQAQPLQY